MKSISGVVLQFGNQYSGLAYRKGNILLATRLVSTIALIVGFFGSFCLICMNKHA